LWLANDPQRASSPQIFLEELSDPACNGCLGCVHSLRVRLTTTGVRVSHFPEVFRVSGLKGSIVVCLVLLLAARVAAQAGSLLLVSDSDVPGAIERSVKRKLGQVADVQAQAMAPSGDAAFSKIASRSGAALIVHLRVTGDGDLLAELMVCGIVCFVFT
jgi:hypothetical protein